MDDCVRRHTEILVDHCTDISPDDNVLVRAQAAANDLVIALYEQFGEVAHAQRSRGETRVPVVRMLFDER